MVYTRTKVIKGKAYTYLQESKREGKKVTTKHKGYLGKGGFSGGGSVGTTKPMGLNDNLKEWGFNLVKADNPLDEETHKIKLDDLKDKKRLLKTINKTHTGDSFNDLKLQFDPEISKTQGGYAYLTLKEKDLKKGLGTTKDNVIYGAKNDKRSNEKIAKDMETNAKTIVNNPKDWKRIGPDKSDLKGWDTTTIKDHRESYVDTYPKIKQELQDIPDAKFEGRIKTLPSMVKKLKKKNVNEAFTHEDFEDIVGTRLTFNNEQELKNAIKQIRGDFKVIEEEDYITKPNFGYRSYHFTLDKDGKKLELQLRTKNQTVWADWMHDRLYDNADKTKERIGEQGFQEAQKYASEMSDYYAKLDKGESAIKPVAPSVVKNELGGEMK